MKVEQRLMAGTLGGGVSMRKKDGGKTSLQRQRKKLQMARKCSQQKVWD